MKTLKQIYKYGFAIICFFSIFSANYAQDTTNLCESVMFGNWSNSAIWANCGGSIPDSTDNVIINSTHSINLDVNSVCNNLTIYGSLNFNTNNRTLNVLGNLFMNDSSSVAGSSATQILNINGNYTVSTGSNSTLSGLNLNTNGNTLVDGNLIFTSNTGIKTFKGLVAINSSGSWLSTAISTNSNLIFRNGITHNNGTNFIAGGATFNSNAQTISGSGSLSFANSVSFTGGNVSLDATGGISFTSTPITVTGVTVTNNTMVSMSNTVAGTLTGTGIWAQGIGSTLNYTGSSITITTMNASATFNTVNYNRSGNQTIFSTSSTPNYHHLVLSGISGITSLSTNLDIDGNISIQNGAVLNDAGFDINLAGDWNNSSVAADPFTESSMITFDGSIPQNIINTGTTSGTQFANLTISNTTGNVTLLNGSASATGSLAFSSGKLILGANNFTLGTATSSGLLSGNSSTLYVVTNGTGYFERYASAGVAIQYPVGISTISDQNLATLTPGDNSIFRVRVDNSVTSPKTTTQIIKAEWSINRTVGVSATTIKLGWTSNTTTGASFDINDARVVIGRWTGENWIETDNSSKTTANPFDVTIFGVNNFNTQFAIGSGTEPLFYSQLTAFSNADTIFCYGDSATITVSANGGTPPYSGTGIYKVIAGTYNYTVTDSLGATANTSITITQPSPLTLVSLDYNPSTCGNADGTATANFEGGTSPYNFNWSEGQTTNPAVNLFANIYTVTVTDANLCTATSSVLVNDISGLTIDIGNDKTVCPNTNTLLDAGLGGITYFWSPGNETTQAITAGSEGTYSVTVTDINGCVAVDEIKITYYPAYVISVSSDTTICKGEIAPLFAGGGVSYAWSPAVTLNNSIIANPVAQPFLTTTYSVTATDGNGCTSTAETTVNVNFVLPATGNDVFICLGESVELNGNGGVSYSWSPSVGLNNTLISNPVASPTQTTEYVLFATGGNGCTSSDTVKVEVKMLPVANAGSDVIISAGESAVLSASGGEFYAWSGGQNNDSITVSPQFTTTYTVLVISNGCAASDMVKVTVTNSPLPTFEFSGTLFGINPVQTAQTNQCESVYNTLTPVFPQNSQNITSPCVSQTSSIFLGIPSSQFRTIFTDYSLTYDESPNAFHKKRIFTNGTIRVQRDELNDGNWVDVLIGTNANISYELDCPDEIIGRIRGEFTGGHAGLLAEYSQTGNNQFVGEFSSVASIINGDYSVYTFSFELLPVKDPVIIQSKPVPAPNIPISFDSVGVSMNFATYSTSGSADSTNATAIYYPSTPPATPVADTIATVFNNFYWELGSTLDSQYVEICFDIDTTKFNTKDYKVYLSVVFQAYLGGEWKVTKSKPVITNDKKKVCFWAEHFSNWALAITKAEARAKIDTLFTNSETISKWISSVFINSGSEASIKLNPGESDNLRTARYDINPGGDLPAGVNSFASSFWEIESSGTGRETILGFDPSSIPDIDTSSGNYKLLYRPDPLTDWTTVSATRVRRGMKEVLITKSSASRTGHYTFGLTDTSSTLFTASAIVEPICFGNQNNFTVNISGGIPPFTYSWYGDDSFTSTEESPTFSYSTTGNFSFTVEITDDNGVPVIVSGIATVNSLPVISAGSDTTICKGEIITLTTVGANTYSWLNTGEIGSSIDIQPEITTLYQVIGTDMNGCSSQAEVTVSVTTSLPDFTIPDTVKVNQSFSLIDQSTGASSWLWNFGDGQNSTEQNPSHTYTIQGTYTICQQVDGCAAVCDTLVAVLMTFIDELLDKKGFAVYPNPSAGVFNVVVPSHIEDEDKIEIVNETGTVLYAEKFKVFSGKQTRRIELPDFPSGIYFLKIEHDGKVYGQQVVVER